MGRSKHNSDDIFGNLKDEVVWEQYYNADGELRYVVTSKKSRDNYFLYEVEGDRLKKIGRNKSPASFEDIIEL